MNIKKLVLFFTRFIWLFFMYTLEVLWSLQAVAVTWNGLTNKWMRIRKFWIHTGTSIDVTIQKNVKKRTLKGFNVQHSLRIRINHYVSCCSAFEKEVTAENIDRNTNLFSLELLSTIIFFSFFFFKIEVLKNFAKLLQKQLQQSLFRKIADCRLVRLLKKDSVILVIFSGKLFCTLFW